MPLYEYQCDACGRKFEKLQKFADSPPESCELCGKGPVHKLLSSPAIQFKGSGWYITDYAKKDQVSSGKNDKGSSASTDTKASSDKTEKPAEKRTADSSPPAASSKDTSSKKEK